MTKKKEMLSSKVEKQAKNPTYIEKYQKYIYTLEKYFLQWFLFH